MQWESSRKEFYPDYLFAQFYPWRGKEISTDQFYPGEEVHPNRGSLSNITPTKHQVNAIPKNGTPGSTRTRFSAQALAPPGPLNPNLREVKKENKKISRNDSTQSPEVRTPLGTAVEPGPDRAPSRRAVPAPQAGGERLSPTAPAPRRRNPRVEASTEGHRGVWEFYST